MENDGRPYSKELWTDLFACNFEIPRKHNICQGECILFHKFNTCVRGEIMELARPSTDRRYLTIPFSLLEKWAGEKAMEYIIAKPEYALKDANEALHEVDLPVIVDDWEKTSVKITGFEPITRIRDIRHEHKNSLISVSGIILRKTDVKAQILIAAFDCQRCTHSNHVQQNGVDVFNDPFECENDVCGRRGPFKLNQDESLWADKRKIRIQEMTDNITDGDQTLGVLDAVMLGDVDCPPLGSVVTVTGILNYIQKVTAQGKTGEFSPLLFVNSIEAQDTEKIIESTPEDLKEMEKMAKDENVIERLVASTVPSVLGHEKIKEACLCCIVSPDSILLPDGRELRGPSHVMICGDPGVAKSVLLRALIRYVPRAQYAAGRAASTKGLTVSVSKESGGWGEGAWVAEAGMLVLADRAFAVIDELDKFEKEEQRDLNTVLEHGIIPVHKAGINRDFYARVPIVASLNPKQGRFDRYELVPKQINVPPDTLSRFDLVFAIFDIPKKDDQQTAEHITKLWQKATEVHQKEFRNSREITEEWEKDKYVPDISIDMMRKWIHEAKKIKVRITSECRISLNEYFMKIRLHRSGDKDAAIPIAWRTLEGMMRLLICETRLRHGKVTEMRDAERVKALIQESMKMMIDPATGELDADIISTGISKSQRDRIRVLKEVIRQLQDEMKTAVPLTDIIERAVESGMKEDDVKDIINKLKSVGELIEASNERYRVA